jgi:hypothetical protein
LSGIKEYPPDRSPPALPRADEMPKFAQFAVSDHRGSNSQAIDFEGVEIYLIFTAKNENHGKSNT